MKPLLVPYAIDVENDRRITTDEIAAMMDDPRSPVRLQATAARDTATRRRLTFRCPECGGALYPHAPRSTGRYFWSHLPRGDGLRCPLEAKRAMTPDDVNAMVFRGRQEGSAHRDLVSTLCRLASLDPVVDAATIVSGAYEPPSAAMRADGFSGRYPDVRSSLGPDKVILEAQLATITLHGINGRRSFYDSVGVRLLWVMRHFDPSGPLRASVRDIVADQAGVLFSVDADTEARSIAQRRFLLRAWRCGRPDAAEETWSDAIVPIEDAVRLVTPPRWADDLKRRWVEAYRGRSFHGEGLPDRVAMLNEMAERIGEPPFGNRLLIESLLRLVRILISLEAGFVTGSDDSSLVSLVNRFHAHKENYRAVTLMEKAVGQFRPKLMHRRSVLDAFSQARRKVREGNARPWGRGSLIGRIRVVLFPDWDW